jgi:catechol 2,3-dioxygenase-like lactoylglutathione lyase family enzyme
MSKPGRRLLHSSAEALDRAPRREETFMTEHARPDIREVRLVGIPVTDQDQALRFYTETLGFELQMDVPLPQQRSRWIVVAPAATAVGIALVAAGVDTPAGVVTGIRFRTPDAAAAHAALEARGVQVGDVLRWPGVPAMFHVHDLDGNRFELVE